MRNAKQVDSKFDDYVTELNMTNSRIFLSVEAFRKKHGLKSLGMPYFIGHGSHEINKIRHRFIVMPRFGSDVWSKYLSNGEKLPLHTVYRLAIQMVNIFTRLVF